MKNRILVASLALVFSAGVASADDMDGDAGKGLKRFKKDTCSVCHAVGPGAADKKMEGPTLNGIIGRKMASIEGYEYSDALKAKGAAGEVWTKEAVFEYLKDPSKFLGGKSKMTKKVKKASRRGDLVTYLAGIKEDGSGADAK